MAARNALTFLVIGRLGGRIRKNLEVAWHWGVGDITMSPKTKQFVAVGVTLAALAALGFAGGRRRPNCATRTRLTLRPSGYVKRAGVSNC